MEILKHGVALYKQTSAFSNQKEMRASRHKKCMPLKTMLNFPKAFKLLLQLHRHSSVLQTYQATARLDRGLCVNCSLSFCQRQHAHLMAQLICAVKRPSTTSIQDRPIVSELSYSKGLTTISNHLMQRTPNFLASGTISRKTSFPQRGKGGWFGDDSNAF